MSSQFLELSLKQLLTDMMRLKEVVVNQRLHDGRTAAAVPPERGVTVAVASRECMRGPRSHKNSFAIETGCIRHALVVVLSMIREVNVTITQQPGHTHFIA